MFRIAILCNVVITGETQDGAPVRTDGEAQKCGLFRSCITIAYLPDAVIDKSTNLCFFGTYKLVVKRAAALLNA
jgi:hypothetical protein